MKIHRLTKAILTVTVSILLMFSVTVSAFAQGVVIKGEPDGQKKTAVMDEHFYSGSLEPNFTSNSVSVSTDSYGMHFGGAYNYGSALVLTAYKLKSYNRFTFSVDMLETNDSFIYCGFGGPDEKSAVGYYDCNICISSGVTALYENGGFDKWNMVNGTPLNKALAVGKTTDFAVTLEKVSGNNYKITFEILENGKPIITTDYDGTFVMENPNGYFCMWGGQNEVFNLRNFNVYDSPQHLAFSDNFENSSLTYGDEAVGNSKWHINQSTFTRDDIFIARNAGPEFKKPNDFITAKNKLVPNDKVSEPYELSFDAKLNKIEKNATFGLFFGAQKNDDINKATIVGISAKDDKFASVNLISNGKIINSGEKRIPLGVLNVGEGTVTFNAKINFDNSLVLSIGDVRFTFNDIKYGGYWGICNYSSDKKSITDARLDKITLQKNTYEPCTQPDLSNDFAGIKLTQDGFEEYYISDRTYYVGPGVSLRPKGAFTTEPSLYFENAGPYSSFGPKKQYTDFILQFDVKTVSEGVNGQSFGVSFGKESYATIPNYSNCINFAYNGWTSEPYTHIATNLCSFDDGTKEKKIEDYHFYKDQDTKYNFMIVAKNRTVYVYFKEDSEDISKLGICRAVIPNVNTAGYVSVFGINGISFDIFNYKLTNIAPEAKEDSGIAIREFFDKEEISDKLVTVGSADVKGGSMQLSNGSIALKNKSLYYIATFTVLKQEADLTVNFSDNKSVVFSKDLNKITVNDGGKNTVFDVSKYNLSDYKSTQIQMILQYDSLSLSAKGVFEPNDKFAKPIAEYTFAESVSEGVLKWTSDNTLIDDILVYSLDNSFKAANIGYEQDPDDKNIWISKLTDKKVPVNSENNDKIPTSFIVVYAVIGVVILVLLAVIIVLTVKKKRGKEQ